MGQVSPPEPEPKRLRTITPPPPFQAWAREVASLEEAGTELAVVFWRVLRRVRAWAETEPGGRARLSGGDTRGARERLGDACAQAPGLVEALGTFALLVRAPEEVEARRLAEACHQVYQWAEERSLLQVAMLFAEAAAIAEPENPAWANDAGRMCRRAARDERASSWYHRGYGLGVRFNNPREVIRAQIGYGNLMKDLGQYEEARKFLERAARRAIYTGRKRQAGEAHHDLLLMCAEIGAQSQAERHAHLAVKLYPLKHPRFPYLVHDFAFLLIERHYYTPALSLLTKLLALLDRPHETLLVWGTLSRAAAGAQQRLRFHEAEQMVLSLTHLHEEYAPAALVHLAEGARILQEWELADRYAVEAVQTARRTKNKVAERVGLEILEKVSAREVAAPEIEPADRERMKGLILRVTARLRTWKAPGRRQPEALSDVSASFQATKS